MATYERLDYGSPDGSQWGGASTEALGTYGATPVTRYPTTLTASSFPVSASGLGTSSIGFVSSTHMQTLVDQVSSVITALQRFGLIS